MDTYRSPHALPNPHEAELLHCLAEEAGEIVKAAMKALRFGLDDGYPGAGSTNREDIAAEIGDLRAVVERLCTASVIRETGIEHARVAKHRKLDRFLQTTPPAGS